MLVTGGATDVTTYFALRLAADGTAATGLTITNFDLQYVRSGAAPSTKVDATALAATDSAHGDNQAIEIDATDQPGLYRVDWPDAAFAAGVPEVILTVKVATAFTEHLRVEIDAPVDTVKVSGDSTAADNLEAMYDGTGYTDDTAPSSRAQVAAIGAASGGSLNFAAGEDNTGGAIKGESFVGVQTSGTYASTEAEDGTYHNITHSTNNITIVYGFDIGGSRTATEVTFKGYLDSANDTITVRAYDFVGSDWETRTTITGQNGTDNITVVIPLLSKHTGTGADLGKVYIEFTLTGGSSPDLFTDELLVAAVASQATIGYEGGAVWLDTNASNTNTESFVDGTADNPVSTLATARTIADNLNLKVIHCLPASSVTLTAASWDSFEFIGASYSLALNGQSIDGMTVMNATVTGTGEATSTQPTFVDCSIGAVTMPPAVLKQCGIGNASGTFTAAVDAGQYILDRCYSEVPGSGSPTFDFSPVNGATGINVRSWKGGATYTLDSNCTLSHEVLAGGGTTITTGGGDVEVRGTCRALTVTMSAAETVQFVGVTGPITLSGTTTGTVNLYGVAGEISDSTTAATVTDDTVVPGLLKRDMSSIAGEASRSLLNAIRFIRNRFKLTGNTLTVYKEDDSTSAWTSTVSTTSGVDPVTESDPT